MISNDIAIQCMVIYQFLKNNHIGKDNAISGIAICNYINNNDTDNNKVRKYFKEPLNKVHLQKLINILRRNEVPGKRITRIIGSNRSGYWLETKKDKGLEFLKNLAISHIKTAVKSGIPLEYFYQVLNSMENSEFIDNQTCLKLDIDCKSQKNVIKRYSDDLIT